MFQKFIADNKSPWIAILAAACLSLGVRVVDYDAFLGCGARGRVFKVIGQDRKLLALKIVKEDFVRSLHNEEAALRRAQDSGLTARLVGKCIELSGGAALLMFPVGKPLPQPTTQSEVATLYRFLWQLHEKDLVHGDPRVPNVILMDKQLFWIDFAEMGKATPFLRQVDAAILTRSILHVPWNIELSEELEKRITSYGNQSPSENIDLLASLVSQSME